MRRFAVMYTSFVMAVGVALMSMAHSEEPAGKEVPRIESLGWLTGSWKGDLGGGSEMDECWGKPASGVILGTCRFMKGGKTNLNEFIILEERPDGIVYVVRHYGPGMTDKDEKPAEFKLTEWAENRAVFEWPENDFPQKLIYVREGDSLTVRLESTKDGKTNGMDIAMKAW